MSNFSQFHIHGDNIVECERTVAFIRQAFSDVTVNFVGPSGSPVCPSYKIVCKGFLKPIILVLYPGFGRWNHDILELVRQRGGTLREAADAIITGVENGIEIPLLAIEYCGALPAGNQAWQRSGRAFSFGKAQIPYFYVAELGGYELGENRVRKAPRLPNPAIPFSFVSFSLANGTPTLPVFVPAPGAAPASRTLYEAVFGTNNLFAFIRACMVSKSDKASIEALRLKTLSFVNTRAESSRAEETLTCIQWAQAYLARENNISLTDFLVNKTRLHWKKTAYIKDMTKSARALMDATANIAIGLTSSKLPMCVVARDRRSEFAEIVENLCEGRIQESFSAWLRRDTHLSICWVMGFKPRGDDARPDRGLPPFTRMLIGDDSDLLTVVYGPAPKSTWEYLHTTPARLVGNGLWESIFEVSDAMLIDSSTDGIRQQGYLRQHWLQDRPQPDLSMILTDPKPTHIGENDIDTVLHLLLAHHAGPSVFEGMCNPPGGDWSGVSLQTLSRTKELRWLTLPRVSASGAKRPDHVFQFFRRADLPPIVLSVESKGTAAKVEADIGPRLTNYICDLLLTPASVERTSCSGEWIHSERTLDITQFLMVSAVAFKADCIQKVDAVKRRSAADLLMAFDFSLDGQSCVVQLIPNTSLGKEVTDIISCINLKGTNIKLIY